MGDVVEPPVKTVKVLVRAEDPDAGDTVAKVELFEDGEVVKTTESSPGDAAVEFEWPAKPGPHFYFAKVTQADGDLLWSAPIWITVAEK